MRAYGGSEFLSCDGGDARYVRLPCLLRRMFQPHCECNDRIVVITFKPRVKSEGVLLHVV